MREKGKPTASIHAVIFVLLRLLVLHSLSSALAYGAPQEEQRNALGSLTTVGEVHVNDAAAPSESTIFAGDILQSSGTGSATFSWTGRGSLQIYPNTEIIFTGESQYAAEVKLGRVVMTSLHGPTGMNLRTGNSVLVAVADGEQSTSNIEAPSDGSFFITCVGGSVGVIPLQGDRGIFIHAGQSVNISAQGELSTLSPQAAPSVVPISKEPAPELGSQRGYKRWILIGLGVAGTGALAAILSTRRPGTPSNNPSASLTPVPSPVSSGGPTSSSSPPPSNPAPSSNNPPSNNPPSNNPPSGSNPTPTPPVLPPLPPLTIHLAFHF
jgi:hypothetical protein